MLSVVRSEFDDESTRIDLLDARDEDIRYLRSSLQVDSQLIVPHRYVAFVFSM